MCQDVVREFLCEYPSKWFTIREISLGTGLSLNSTFDNCKMMRKPPSTILYRVEKRLVGKVYKDVTVYRFKRC